MADQLTPSPRLIGLANSSHVNRSRDLEKAAASLDVAELRMMYEELRDTCPHRHDRDKQYFVGHTGVPSTVAASGRVEEHLAIALCNDFPDLAIGDSGSLRLLDYQVPLKARQSDAGIGKVDIIALTNAGRISVVELKVTTETSKGDSPLRAVLESLAYCAIVEANTGDISSEIQQRFDRTAVDGRPDLVVMGTDAYWSDWTRTALEPVHDLADRIADALEIRPRFVNLGDVSVQIGSGGARPQLIGHPFPSNVP